MTWQSKLRTRLSACKHTIGSWRRSWFPNLEHDAPRIPDEYYSRLIRMYRARAKSWRTVGLFCLGLTAVIIVFGFGIFYRGNPINEQRAESEIQLAVELAGERRKLTDLGNSGARTLAQVGITSRASVLSDVLGRLKPMLNSFFSNPDDARYQRLRTVTDANLRIVTALKSAERQQQEDGQPTEEAVINISGIFPNDSMRFPAQSLELLRLEIRSTGESADTVSGELNRISSLVRTMPTNAETEELRQLAGSAVLSALEEVDRQIELREKQTAQALKSWQRDAPVREEQRQAIESNIGDIEEQLGEVRAERDKLLFMSWVPDLTLRVGSVVLLLFLTQILLSAYRYTISLSTFYLARADAIQMLQPQVENATWYDIEHFEKLVDKLSPTAITIDAVKSPSERVVDLATAWIGRKGK